MDVTVCRQDCPPGWQHRRGRLYSSLHRDHSPLTVPYTQKRSDKWTHHTARITSLSFSSTHLASTSLDTHVYVYTLKAPFSGYVHVAGAAPMGGAVVSWLPQPGGGGDVASARGAKARVVSGGADGCVRVWEVVLP